MNFWRFKIIIYIINLDTWTKLKLIARQWYIYEKKNQKIFENIEWLLNPREQNIWGLKKIIKLRRCMKKREAFFSHMQEFSCPSADNLLISFNTRWSMWNVHQILLYCKPIRLYQVLKKEIIETELWSFSTIWFEIWKEDKLPAYGLLKMAIKRIFNTVSKIKILYTWHENKHRTFIISSFLFLFKKSFKKKRYLLFRILLTHHSWYFHFDISWNLLKNDSKARQTK